MVKRKASAAPAAPPAKPPHRARMAPLPPVFPHAWAVAYGEDRFGLWQAFEVNGVRQVLRWLPPGEFEMGSPQEEPGRSDDETLHPVRLTQGFWLADTACTQALWAAVMDGDAPSHFAQDAENPVEQVSWDRVVSGLLPRVNALLPGLDLRLPTEAEWEYACRSDAPERSPFWFGQHIDIQQVNFGGSFPMLGGEKLADRNSTVPVKALSCNAWGLHQMHGNVYEWCLDWYAPYPTGDLLVDPSGPPQAPEQEGRRVLRGGSWLFNERYCRSANRDASDPSNRNGNIGFRLVRGAS